MQDLHQCSSNSGHCLREEDWGRTDNVQHRAYVLNGTGFLFQEHLTFRKGAADPGVPAYANTKTLHQLARSPPLREPRGQILIPPPPCVWRIAFSQERALARPLKVWGGRKGFLHSSLQEGSWSGVQRWFCRLSPRQMDRRDGCGAWQRPGSQEEGAPGVGDRGNGSSLLEWREGGRHGAGRGLVHCSKFTQSLY